MAMLIIRNKNREIYGLKSKIRKYCRHNRFVFNTLLRMKELIIKKGAACQGEDKLFDKIYIETVSYCNNDCPFCAASVKVGIKRPGDFMQEALFMKIITELKDISFSGSVAFHCNNEPLLDSRLVFLIKKARGLLKGNYFYLYTNGILLNVKLANDLFEAGLNRIILNNYNDEFKPLPSVKDILNNSGDLKGEVILNYRFKKEYLQNRAGQNPYADILLKKPLDVLCVRPSREMVVGYDGTVPLCCVDAAWKAVMGNVKEARLEDIWFSDLFKNARKLLAAGDRRGVEICRLCDALNFSAPKGI